MTQSTEVRTRRSVYYPALDGLRAFAVLAVLFYHHQGKIDNVGRGGFIGVDIFFVLSGFLITSILLTEFRESGRIALGRFWVHRARRLLPALLVTLLLAGVLAHSVFSPASAWLVHEDSLWSLVYLQNWHRAVAHGGIGSPLAHLWSLSVEEQWYLAWPVVLVFLARWCRRRNVRLVVAILIGAVVSAGLMAYLYATYGGARAYFGTDGRAQELLIGAALAAWSANSDRQAGLGVDRFLRWCGTLALVMLSAVVLAVPGGREWYFGGYLLLALLSAAVIGAAVQTSGPVARALSVGPLVRLGRWSYGIYLFHLPLFAWIDAPRTGTTGVTLLIIRLSATVALAGVSYRFLEQPIREGRVPGRRLVLAGAAGVVAVVAVMSFGINAIQKPSPSTVLASALRGLHDQRPAGTTSVLIVGGNRAAVLSYLSRGTYRTSRVYGAAIGTSGCGLTSPSRRCRELPDHVGGAVRAFRASAVVLMPDEGDLVGFGGVDPGQRDADAVVVRLDRVLRAIGRRRVVIARIPCSIASTPTRDAFNQLIEEWSRAHDVRLSSAVPAACTGLGASEPVARTWALLTRDIR